MCTNFHILVLHKKITSRLLSISLGLHATVAFPRFNLGCALKIRLTESIPYYIILEIDLYRCRSWCHALAEEQKLHALENKVLKYSYLTNISINLSSERLDMQKALKACSRRRSIIFYSKATQN